MQLSLCKAGNRWITTGADFPPLLCSLSTALKFEAAQLALIVGQGQILTRSTPDIRAADSVRMLSVMSSEASLK